MKLQRGDMVVVRGRRGWWVVRYGTFGLTLVARDLKPRNAQPVYGILADEVEVHVRPRVLPEHRARVDAGPVTL